MERGRSLLGARRPGWRSGLAVAALSVVAATAVVYPLRTVAPVVSLGVVYLLAVLLVSTYWGLWLGLLTSLVSALAFNFFHIPPTGQFTLADSRNWVALAAFAVVAVATSRIADLARSREIEAQERRQDADLGAELARILLGPTPLPQAAPVAAHAIAQALRLPSAKIELAPGDPGPRETRLPLGSDGLAALVVPVGVDGGTEARLKEHVVPALEAVVVAAVERDRMQSELVTTEALRQSDELKTALLRAVSHDLRTPLTAIRAAGEALAAPDIQTGEREDLAAAITAESTRLGALVEKLLDLSRLQAAPATTAPQECALDEPLLAARATIHGGIEITVEDPPPVVSADPAQLERAFANLLENAVRYSNGQPVLVRVRRVGPRAIVRIVDRGPGISPAEQQRIFEPFYRSPDSGHLGAGLGLAIAKGFIEANGGTLDVESLPSQGTTFVATWPIDAD